MTEKVLKKQMLRNAEYYDMTNVFDELYNKSIKNNTFNNLIPLISSRNNILMAYRTLKKNSGSYTAGVDGQTIKEISNMDTETFITVVQNKLRNYHPKPVRRVEIPKPNGDKRPLGIPTMIDRIVQQSILQVLEPICEAKFHDRSNGFRPNRSCETAISQCHRMMQLNKLFYVVDVDIKGFFDNVNHGKLLKQMWTLGIRDKNLICIISKMLKAPIKLSNGNAIHPDKGTPQGGVLSPLLSNIVLNELDWWISRQWECFPTKHEYQGSYNKNGRRSQGNKYRAMRDSNLKEMYIVRYADDFKIFCSNYNDALKIKMAVISWLNERLHLEVNSEKTKIINLKKKYTEFLGFKFKVVRKGNRYSVESHMCDKAILVCKKNLMEAIKKIENPKDSIDEQKAIERFNAKVIGIHNYFSIATHISRDCDRIGWSVNLSLKHRIRQRLKRTGKQNDYIWKRYGKSKQIRFIAGRAIAPIGYVQTRKPMDKKLTVNKFTKAGREEIHKSLIQIDAKILIWLSCNPVVGRSTEYNDNRISLYVAQKGKCAILGTKLDTDEIECHHIEPYWKSKSDKYSNLIIVHPYIHKLIHIKNQSLIEEYLDLLKLSKKEIKKVNKFREKVGNEIIK